MEQPTFAVAEGVPDLSVMLRVHVVQLCYNLWNGGPLVRRSRWRG